MGIRTEILVAGGGPAGLAAAIALRRERFAVTLVDPGSPPMDRPCGEGLLPDGVKILQDLGITLPSETVRYFSGIRYIENHITATGHFPAGPGIGIRRTLLHRLLARRATDMGARLLWGERVRRLTADGAELSNGSIQARWIVAADGKDSSIRHQLGLDGKVRSRRIGIRRHYRIEPWSHMVEVYWGRGAEAYVTPVSGGEICVAILTSDPKPRFDTMLSRFPALMARLHNADISSTDKGAALTFRRARRVVLDRVALLGDASASVDAITGEGVTLSLHQVLALAHALRSGSLAGYARDHQRLMRLPLRMTAFMLAVHRRPGLRRRVIATLANRPALFSRILALHTRHISFSRFLTGMGPFPPAGQPLPEVQTHGN